MSKLPLSGAKICGLSTPETVKAAVDAGAAFIGFVFFPKSPRNVSPELARDLGAEIPACVLKTGLFVKQSVAEIAQIVETAKLDAIQLHGTYNAADINAVKSMTGKPVLWVKGISCEADFDGIEAETAAADYLLFDAKAPAGSDRPGGNALSFDWTLLANRSFSKPWMLAGGLNPDNVAEAMAKTGAKLVDVSSGVETAPGVKSDMLIKDFVQATR
ncbi:MAG: phosphoribosylanthranilate isomerase [Alphaproteobacteria bacterium]